MRSCPLDAFSTAKSRCRKERWARLRGIAASDASSCLAGETAIPAESGIYRLFRPAVRRRPLGHRKARQQVSPLSWVNGALMPLFAKRYPTGLEISMGRGESRDSLFLSKEVGPERA